MMLLDENQEVQEALCAPPSRLGPNRSIAMPCHVTLCHAMPCHAMPREMRVPLSPPCGGQGTQQPTVQRRYRSHLALAGSDARYEFAKERLEPPEPVRGRPGALLPRQHRLNGQSVPSELTSAQPLLIPMR